MDNFEEVKTICKGVLDDFFSVTDQATEVTILDQEDTEFLAITLANELTKGTKK